MLKLLGMSKQNTKIINARTINKLRCIVGLVLCSIVIVLTVVSLTLNFINFYNEDAPEAGVRTLRMYTTLSNIIATLGASICIPFQIDGLRKNRYKLPKWVVEVLYVGATGVFLTFVTALSFISINLGFEYAMIVNSNLFMHTLNPIFITISFTVAISDSHLKFKDSFITIVPTIVYAMLYFVLVFITNTWRDHYSLENIMPWPVEFILIIAFAFGLSQLLRLLHNLTNKFVNKNIERYYKESPDYEFEKITFAIQKLALEEAKYYHVDDEIYIPVDIIQLLSQRYKTATLPLDIQYDIYLEAYLENIHKKDETHT